MSATFDVLRFLCRHPLISVLVVLFVFGLAADALGYGAYTLASFLGAERELYAFQTRSRVDLLAALFISVLLLSIRDAISEGAE